MAGCRELLNIFRPTLVTLAAISVAVAFRADDLSVLRATADDFSVARAFENALQREFLARIEERSQEFERLQSTDDCWHWQESRREYFLRQIGGLPHRTSLNPRTIATLQGEGYRIEKNLYQSRPGFHVTANVYLPESARHMVHHKYFQALPQRDDTDGFFAARMRKVA